MLKHQIHTVLTEVFIHASENCPYQEQSCTSYNRMANMVMHVFTKLRELAVDDMMQQWCCGVLVLKVKPYLTDKSEIRQHAKSEYWGLKTIFIEKARGWEHHVGSLDD